MGRWPVVASVLLLVAAGCGGGEPEGVPPGVTAELEPGHVIDGTPETYRQILGSLEGRPVVVSFWASWCDPCREQVPAFTESVRRYEGRVHFLGVSVEDGPEDARSFARTRRIPFGSLADPRGDIRRTQEVLELPTTKFYRGDGKLAFVHAGEIDPDRLEKKVRELIRIGVPATPNPPSAD